MLADSVVLAVTWAHIYSPVKNVMRGRLHMSTSKVILADGQSVAICGAPVMSFDSNVYRQPILCVSKRVLNDRVHEQLSHVSAS